GRLCDGEVPSQRTAGRLQHRSQHPADAAAVRPMTPGGAGACPPGVSVVIPTYRRENVLLDTIAALLRLEDAPEEILVIDQTSEHDEITRDRLARWDAEGRIRWIRLDTPSIPNAMNRGLLLSSRPVVLFVDDDIVPADNLVAAHRRAHSDASVAAVAGRV